MSGATNWWLLHRHDPDGRVVAFAELVQVDGRTLLRTGKPQTWGLNEDVDDVDSTLQRLFAEGFALQREWCFDPQIFDAKRFEKELLAGARTAFQRLRRDHAGLRRFALQTDDSAMTIAAIADSSGDVDGDDSLMFSPSEWRLQDDGADLDIAYRLILAQHRDDLSLVGFDVFRAAFDAAVVDVLVQLADEGVFGDAGADRVVLYDVSDDETPAAMLSSWTRLNDEALLARLRGAVGP